MEPTCGLRDVAWVDAAEELGMPIRTQCGVSCTAFRAATDAIRPVARPADGVVGGRSGWRGALGFSDTFFKSSDISAFELLLASR